MFVSLSIERLETHTTSSVKKKKKKSVLVRPYDARKSEFCNSEL